LTAFLHHFLARFLLDIPSRINEKMLKKIDQEKNLAK